MTVYIDKDYKCSTTPAADRTAVDAPFFDGKCSAFIEGYRFVPAGHEWTRSDGVVFKGEMVAPWKDHVTLIAAQRGYEESLAEMQDMTDALNLLGVVVDG